MLKKSKIQSDSENLKNRVKESANKWILLLLRFFCFSLFIGRAFQHLIWDAPYRAILWDQESMEPIINKVLGLEWTNFAANSDPYIQTTIVLIGCCYLFFSFSSLLLKPNKNEKLGFSILFLASFFLLILAVAQWKDKGCQFAQLIEMAVQITCPLALYFALFKPDKKRTFKWLCSIALAFTFIGHGLYAVGYYPVPGPFQQMFITVIGVNESGAIQLLKLVGYLDFIAAAFLFLPYVRIPALAYMVFWGFLTAFARVLAHYSSSFPLESLGQWWFSTVYRLPHGGLALVLLVFYFSYQTKQKKGLAEGW